MPGLTINGQHFNGEGADRDRGRDSDHGGESEMGFKGRGLPRTNGSDDAPNGFSTNDVGYSSIGSSPSAVRLFQELPAEVEHITFGYQPLSRLITRLVQETFRNMTETILSMSDMPPLALPHQDSANYHHNHTKTNGINGGNSAPLNVEKRMRMLNWGHDTRAQFIKVLVLSQWSRNAGDVSKVIDLKVWLDKQRGLYDEAGGWLGELKRNLSPAKMPNPDLKTALEVMSTGKASWLSDLGYIPPYPLKPQHVLKTLRNINTLLSIRLNLYEDLPAHFKSFTIASGRATFSVPCEFEVDLSLASEDPSLQLYFIDFRFLFAPSAPQLPSGRLRDTIEGRVNDVLKNEGLVGCYAFLHEMTLTHKIMVLHKQAVEMSRGKWTESIRFDLIRRTLIVHYWVNRPVPKNWVEIGITSGRHKHGSTIDKQQSISFIGLRWFCGGREAKNTSEIDFRELSMEQILRNITALHTYNTLDSVRDKLSTAGLYSKNSLELSMLASTTGSVGSTLAVQLTTSRFVSITVEPVTGCFALEQSSVLYSNFERILNDLQDPAAEAHNQIARLRCLSNQEEIESRARCVGWEPLKTLAPKQEDVKRIFPRDTILKSFFRRRGWGKQWVVAVGIGMSGEFWCIIELEEQSTPPAFGISLEIPTFSSTSSVSTITYAFLCRLEHAAAGIISQFVNVRELKGHKVRHTLRPASQSASNSPDNHTITMPALYIQISSLIHRQQGKIFWAKDVLKVRFQGLSTEGGQAILLAEARLMTSVPSVDLAKDQMDDEVAFNPPYGTFTFRLKTSVGESIIQKLVERLKRIERLSNFVSVVKRFKLKCETVSLGRIVFEYSANPMLKADVCFAGDSPVTIKLEEGNPHIRIKDYLVNLVNSQGGFEYVTLLLGATLPLLQALDAIEKDVNTSDVLILPRSADWLHVKYGKAQRIFSIRLRQRRDDVKWFIHEESLSLTIERGTEYVADALKQLFSGNGNGWLGLQTGIVAGVDEVAEVIRRIDAIMKQRDKGASAVAKGGPDVVVLD